MDGIKHLVECRCILPQYKRRPDPVLHRFPVFSVIDNSGAVIPKFAQCPSCGVVHHVTEVGKSTIQTGRDEIRSVTTVDEVKMSLPDKLVGVLEGYDIPLSTWEEAQFIVENRLWGRFVVVDTETFNDSTTGKLVKILGDNLFKIETFTRNDTIDTRTR